MQAGVSLFGIYVLFAAGIAAFLLGLFPVVHHLTFGLGERRREIICLLDDKAAGHYFDQFYHAVAAKMKMAPRKELERLYDRRFGKRSFALAFVVYTLALATAVIATGTVAGAQLPGNPVVALIDPMAAYALAGAYLWVVSDLIGRYRQRNLVPSALYFAAFRIVIAIPLAVAIGAALKEGIAAPVAFLLGAFPTTTLLLVARRTVGQRLGLGDQADPQKPPEIEVLQGVNRPIAETFSDVGVSTLVQLAYDDPIQLAMRTNLSFYFVLDIVSQALVAIYVDPAVARRYSIRGSVEASSLAKSYFAGNETAKKVVTELAGELKLSEAVLSVVLGQIAEDPCSQFINAIWNSGENPEDDERIASGRLILTVVETGGG